jgi:hypothetical protein
MPGKKTVSVKRFLTDFRSGASDADLMTRHGLDRKGLQKMLSILEERQLVPVEDLKRNRDASSDEDHAQPTPPPSATLQPRESDGSLADDDTASDGPSGCPQCGAHVTEKMLTCPECGHVLPGETRWSRVQPERSTRYPLPPWLIGCIIACPIALGLYAVFKHMLIPMSTASIQKRTLPVAKPTAPKYQQGQRTQAPEPALSPVEELVKRSTANGKLLRTAEDYTSFTVGDQWYGLERDDKVQFLTQLASALLASGMTSPFEVRDDAGILGARVNRQAFELFDRFGYSETIPRTDTQEGQRQPRGN